MLHANACAEFYKWNKKPSSVKWLRVNLTLLPRPLPLPLSLRSSSRCTSTAPALPLLSPCKPMYSPHPPPPAQACAAEPVCNASQSLSGMAVVGAVAKRQRQQLTEERVAEPAALEMATDPAPSLLLAQQQQVHINRPSSPPPSPMQPHVLTPSPLRRRPSRSSCEPRAFPPATLRWTAWLLWGAKRAYATWVTCGV